MGFFISAATGGYYEGDQAAPADLAVPQRPSTLYMWSNGAWVIDPAQQAAATKAAQLATDQSTVLSDSTITTFLALTPAQVDNWINNNVVDIPSTRTALRIVAKLVRTLAMKVFPQ